MWFPYSVIATVAFGVAMALYKLPAAKRIDRYAVTVWSLAVSAALATVVFVRSLPLVSWSMVPVAALWGVSFTGIMLLQMYALHHMDTSVLFPATTTSSLVATVLIGLLAFRDPVSPVQVVGVVVIIGTVYAFLFRRGRFTYARHLLSVAIGIIAFSVVNKLLQKIAADRFDVMAYQVVQYVLAAVFSFVVLAVVHRRKAMSVLVGPGGGAGALIGAVSFLGGAAFFQALARGPFTLITSIHSLYTFATAITAWLLFRERLTIRRIILIAFAIAGVLLIRLG